MRGPINKGHLTNPMSVWVLVSVALARGGKLLETRLNKHTHRDLLGAPYLGGPSL